MQGQTSPWTGWASGIGARPKLTPRPFFYFFIKTPLPSMLLLVDQKKKHAAFLSFSIFVLKEEE